MYSTGKGKMILRSISSNGFKWMDLFLQALKRNCSLNASDLLHVHSANTPPPSPTQLLPNPDLNGNKLTQVWNIKRHIYLPCHIYLRAMNFPLDRKVLGGC